MMHDALALLSAALCMWAVVHPRVPTGLLPTLGLGVMFVASMWSLDDWASADGVLDLMTVGVCLVGVGGFWRVLRRPRNNMMRRNTDWGELETLDEDRQRQVSGGKGTP